MTDNERVNYLFANHLADHDLNVRNHNELNEVFYCSEWREVTIEAGMAAVESGEMVLVVETIDCPEAHPKAHAGCWIGERPELDEEGLPVE